MGTRVDSAHALELVEGQHLAYYRWTLFQPWRNHFTAGLTCRRGGVSPTPWDSLNLGHNSPDSADNVAENRYRLLRMLGKEPRDLQVLDQVHGSLLVTLDGTNRYQENPIRGDGFVVLKPGLIAMVLLADCHPVVLYDPVNRQGALCHAGWRGSAGGIARQAVLALTQRGSSPHDVLAACGPGIGPCCYEVGEDTAKHFSHPPFEQTIESQNGAQPRINLEQANLEVLVAAGLKRTNIATTGLCTACLEEDFFSYRRDKGKTGRQAAFFFLH